MLMKCGSSACFGTKQRKCRKANLSIFNVFIHSPVCPFCCVHSAVFSRVLNTFTFFFLFAFQSRSPEIVVKQNEVTHSVVMMWRTTHVYPFLVCFFLPRKLNENKPHSSECGCLRKTENGLEPGYDEVGVDYGLIKTPKHFLFARTMCAPPPMLKEKRRENLKFQLSRFRCELCI